MKKQGGTFSFSVDELAKAHAVESDDKPPVSRDSKQATPTAAEEILKKVQLLVGEVDVRDYIDCIVSERQALDEAIETIRRDPDMSSRARIKVLKVLDGVRAEQHRNNRRIKL